MHSVHKKNFFPLQNFSILFDKAKFYTPFMNFTFMQFFCTSMCFYALVRSFYALASLVRKKSHSYIKTHFGAKKLHSKVKFIKVVQKYTIFWFELVKKYMIFVLVKLITYTQNIFKIPKKFWTCIMKKFKISAFKQYKIVCPLKLNEWQRYDQN